MIIQHYINVDENDDLNILNDLKATNEHELEILEKLKDICLGTLSDMIMRNFNSVSHEIDTKEQVEEDKAPIIDFDKHPHLI